jgi:hypothetical protein
MAAGLGWCREGCQEWRSFCQLWQIFWQNVGSLSGCFLQAIDLKRTFHSARGGMELVTLSHAKASVLEIFLLVTRTPAMTLRSFSLQQPLPVGAIASGSP